MRYAVQVQYTGKNYAGSQIQFENGRLIALPTIQGELEKALCTFIIGSRCGGDDMTAISPKNQDKTPENTKNCIYRPIKTVFSGRTDRGVNSLGQVVHFDTDKEIVASNLIYHVNEILPADISISDLRTVSPDFHAQKSAVRRCYRFEFVNRRFKQAFDGDLIRVKYPIDIDRMNKSLSYLIGEHDFSSFKSSGTLNPSKVCILYRACVEKKNDRVVLDIEGNRFLYNMVRTIVGTLFEIEGHNLKPEHMKNVLEAKDRRKAGQTVSPYGLTLMKVIY
ncbi:MAG: tRNA pseudouridine(38-40) synthase TruA [Candidatus Gastranaerophilales bacterium]|nr:tRNA pseudouridine(38-40) synthase TruA [Candidatus Gastranaerophilales bacterium]